MIKIAFALLALLTPLTVQAADEESGIPPECRILPEHKPSADVAYKAGVDVHGKAVVPADLNATPSIVPETIVVPLSIDLAERLQNHGVAGLQLEGNLGYLEIHQDGRVSHNGQDWTSQVHVLCGKMPVSADGQPPEDVIKYDPATQAPAKKQEAAKPEAKPSQEGTE